VFDKRGVKDLSDRFEIEVKHVRQILAYFYAASRDRAELDNKPTKITSRKENLRSTCRSPSENWCRDRPSPSPRDLLTPQGQHDAPRIDLPVQFEEKYDESSNIDDGFRSQSDINLTPYEQETPYDRETETRGLRSVDTRSPSVNIITGPYASPSLQRVTTVGSFL